MEEKGAKKERKKLTKSNTGYAITGFLDAAAYDFIGEFGLFFLTSIVRLPSGIAGAILSFANIVTAILSPIVGYVSDRNPAKMGKRRSFILFGGIAAIIALPFMLIPLPLDGGVKVFFYGAVVLIFFIGYTFYSVPYLAYGADISTEYDERSDLLTLKTIVENIGTASAYVLSTSAIALFMGLGMTEHISWFVAVLIICGISLICLLIGFVMTRGHDAPAEKNEKINILKFIKDMLIAYASAMKLKTLRIMILIILFAMIGYTIKTNGEMFMLTYCCNLSAGAVAFYFLISTGIISVIRPIPTNWFLRAFGKKGGFMICVGLYVVSALYFLMTGIDSLGDAIIYGIFNGFILDGYWQIIPAMVYDIADVDMYFYKKERKGTLVSFQALVEGIGGGVGTLISGLFLAFYHFNEDAAWEAEEMGTVAEQSQHAVDGVLYLSTIVPAVFFAISALLVLLFPINKRRHGRLLEAIDKGVRAEDNDPEYDDLKILN